MKDDETQPEPMAAKTIDRLHEQAESACAYAVSMPAVDDLWTIVFTDAEKAVLQNDHGVVPAYRMWQKVRGGTEWQAVIAICMACCGMNEAIGRAILKRFDKPPLGDAILKSAAKHRSTMKRYWRRRSQKGDWLSSMCVGRSTGKSDCWISIGQRDPDLGRFYCNWRPKPREVRVWMRSLSKAIVKAGLQVSSLSSIIWSACRASHRR